VDEIYLTTETQGLWRSTNINAPTPAFSLVNSYDFRQPERIFFNPFNPSEIWASSFGNGMKKGDIPTYISEPPYENFSFELFPNPAVNEFIIYNPQFTIEQVEIYNVTGEKCFLLNPFQKSATINVSGLNPGIYYVKAHTLHYSDTQKLIILK
jgi:hypothetical protein